MAYTPRHFGLDVRGLLYPDRGDGAGGATAAGRRSRLRGRLQMSITFVLPPMLALVPEQVLRGVADSVTSPSPPPSIDPPSATADFSSPSINSVSPQVLGRLLQRMKEDVNGSLLSDFQSFRKERMKAKQLLKKPAQRQLLHPDSDQTP